MRILGCICLSLLFGVAVSAQTVINGPGSGRAFVSTKVAPQNIVRDSGGSLYVIYRYQVSTVNSEWRLGIARSTNQGATWNKTWQSGFDYYVSGGVGNIYPCMAIDSKDNLHCAWWHRGTGSSYETRYNRYDAAAKTWGTEWKVTATGATCAPNLAVDQSDHVWFVYWKSSYHVNLARSNLPTASDLKFSIYSPAFPGGSSDSNAEVVVDALGRIHMTYYDTGSGFAGIKHRWIDPGASTPAWSAPALISNHSGDTARAEYESCMSGDNTGNVYLIYTVDSQGGTSSRTKDTEFYLRKWDGPTQKWGNPVLVHSVPVAVWHPGYKTSVKDYNSGQIIGSACDETTGEFYFGYRDFTTGDYVVGRWRGIDTEGHTIYARLMNTSPSSVTTRNFFLYPHFRGSLWPAANRTSWGLDILYSAGDMTATTPIYTDYFEHFPIASMNSTGAPKIGTTYPVGLSAVTEGGKAYITALSMSGLMPVLKLNRRFLPITTDSLFYLTVVNVLPGVFVNFQGLLTASGTAQAGVAIPNAVALIGVQIDGCFVTYDGSGVHALSNPWGFQITN